MRRYFRVLRERDMNMTDEQIVESFYAMWDNFPESVMLIKKSREIIAVNLKAAEFNLKPGSKSLLTVLPTNIAGTVATKR